MGNIRIRKVIQNDRNLPSFGGEMRGQFSLEFTMTIGQKGATEYIADAYRTFNGLDGSVEARNNSIYEGKREVYRVSPATQKNFAKHFVRSVAASADEDVALMNGLRERIDSKRVKKEVSK